MNPSSSQVTRLLLLVLLAVFFLGAALYGNAPGASAVQAGTGSVNTLYLPVLLKHLPLRRINVPHFDGSIPSAQSAIAWFGKVTPTDNYADIRVGYNDAELYVYTAIFDRRLWYNPKPLTSDLTLWDSVDLYLDVNGNSVNAPDLDAYRFVAQLDWWENPRTNWQASYRDSGSAWVSSNISFTTQTGWRGDAPNDNIDDRGWSAYFHIPFSSLGLSGPPSQGTLWKMGLVLHDRDDAVGTPIPVKTWPEYLEPDQPSTWGQISFGLLPPYVPPRATPRSIVTIRNGLDGAVVPDANVGGWSTCGAGLDFWTQWGDKAYPGQTQINIQNQSDVADWPCFSKYYITFPLNSIPPGKVVISSTLTLYQFGNAGQGWNPGPTRSLIQVMTVNDNWDEATLTWNNAPLAAENVSQAFVDPINYLPPWPGLARTWDVSSAVASAYAAGRPLRLVLYSADTNYHSGKYFYSSDADPPARPALSVLWGDP